MANLDEGAVLGGRYQITGRVMASSEQDQVLTGLDQVLNREVLILVASRENASQAAQSARQLATGERASSIQILDLGLSDDRTYLVAPGNADVEDLLALLTNQDVYVEPFFTEALGTELFGESRSNAPQTFDDDAEYYAELQDDLQDEQEDTSKRPEFLNKISDRIDDWLHEETDEVPVVPGQDSTGSGTGAAAGTAAAAGAAAAGSNRKQQDDEDTGESEQDSPNTEQTEQQQPPVRSRLPILDDDYDQDDQPEPSAPDRPDQPEAAPAPVPEPRRPKEPTEPEEPPQPEEPEAPEADQERTQVVPPVPEDQPESAAAAAQQPSPDQPAEERTQQRPTPIIPPPAPESEPSPEDGYAIQYTDEPQRSTMGRWLGGLLLIAVLVGAVVLGFQFLGSPEEEPAPVAEEPTEEAPAENETEEPAEEETPEGPEPVPASVERVVPDAPELSNEYESDLPAIVDGNQATAWHTLTFTTPQFGGFASNLALVVELEEQAPISEVTISQNQGTGGAFTVAVANEPDPEGGVMLTDGSFTGPEYTVDAHDADGEPIEARYVIINFTELPTLSNTNSPDRPYGLRIAEIDVN